MQVFILSLCYTIFNSMKEETISSNDVSERLDVAAARFFGMTRSQAQKAIHATEIRVNDKQSSPNRKLRLDDVVTYAETPAAGGMLIAENLPVSILYRDDSVIVVDKPAGLVVYPAAGHSHGTLLNALAYHCLTLATVGGPLRPGVVHRLDKDTSGVMVVALDDPAYYHLVEQFRERSISRQYRAIVFGKLKGESGEIDLEIGRSTADRKKMSTRTQAGKEAVTRWCVLERFQDATLVEARLSTGRTHQIRVHFSAIGHPVLGDEGYGRKTVLERGRRKIVFPRQMLHAEILGFTHPATGERLQFSSPLPQDMRVAVESLRV
ncbi:MAG TPA: RluA family pseudouridine synthase [Dissulfurispiraceae bacterium]|nr:RluA family pseudouridine synthase [Dissulfurispiraceae bacterium]